MRHWRACLSHKAAKSYLKVTKSYLIVSLGGKQAFSLNTYFLSCTEIERCITSKRAWINVTRTTKNITEKVTQK